MAIAAFLASIGTSVGALAIDNGNLAAIGIVCAMLSAAIYAAAEAYVDGHNAMSNSNITTTTTTIGASTTAKDTVEKMLTSVQSE